MAILLIWQDATLGILKSPARPSPHIPRQSTANGIEAERPVRVAGNGATRGQLRQASV